MRNAPLYPLNLFHLIRAFSTLKKATIFFAVVVFGQSGSQELGLLETPPHTQYASRSSQSLPPDLWGDPPAP